MNVIKDKLKTDNFGKKVKYVKDFRTAVYQTIRTGGVRGRGND